MSLHRKERHPSRIENAFETQGNVALSPTGAGGEASDPPGTIFDLHSRSKRKIKFKEVEVIEADPIEWLGFVKATVADEYTKFHRNFPKSLSRKDPMYRQYLQSEEFHDLHLETLENVSDDEIGTSDRATTFVAFTDKDGFVGTARFIQGKGYAPYHHGPQYPLETYKFWRPTAPQEWPHRKKRHRVRKRALREDEIGEIGRIVVGEAQRPQNTGVILKTLFDQIFEHAREKGIKELYITMPTDPPRLYRRLREIGIRPKQVEGVELRERDPRAREVMDIYSGYWREQDAKLYTIKVPEKIGSKLKKVADIYVNHWIRMHQREVLKGKKAA